MSGINLVDVGVISLLVISALIGLLRGFTRELLGIFAWIGALIAAIYGLVLLRPLLLPYIKNPFIADVVSGIIIFIIVLFILGSLSRSLSLRVKGSALGGLDRSLGLIFGIVRGGALFVIAYFIASLVSNVDKWPTEIKDAKTYPYVVESTAWFRSMIPEDAIKNLGLKIILDDEENSMKGKTPEEVVKALSQPKASVTPSPRRKREKER
jgi:membrane protein required for colicin V production